MGQESALMITGLLSCGGAGALVKEILDDGCLTLPRIKDGKIVMGFIGSIIVGAAVGLLVDHSPLVAFFAGYTGFSAAMALLPSSFKRAALPVTQPSEQQPVNTATSVVPTDVAPLSIPEIIKRAADKYGVSYTLALQVAKCESGLNPLARNVNKEGSIDRGLYQINSKWHPEVTEQQADDPVFAAEWFCKAVLAGNLSWWNASKKCWSVAQ